MREGAEAGAGGGGRKVGGGVRAVEEMVRVVNKGRFKAPLMLNSCNRQPRYRFTDWQPNS